MPSHASLLHNFKLLQGSTQSDHTTTVICALPHFNPVGLLCHYLFVPYCGATGYFTSHETVSKSPSLWLQMISRFRGTFSVVPNAVLDNDSSTEVPPNVDLGSLHFLGNGSDSVSTESMRRFRDKFSGRGLRKGVLQAFYWLSEHTMLLCSSTEDELVVEGSKVSSGRPHPSISVRIVDPNTREEVGEGEEGEVWVDSESKAMGYWNREELTKEVFRAQLVGDKEKIYLRTGDMGFLLSGRLFVSGRRENLMLVSGRRVYMNDIEHRMEAQFPELRPGRTAAVEWDSTLALADHMVSPTHTQAPRKGIGLFAELQNEEHFQAADCHALTERIAAQVGLYYRVETLLVALLPKNTMPHSCSGERHRPLCKARHLSGLLQVIYQWSPSSTDSRAVRPECVPLPPTPIPAKQSTTRKPPSPGQKQQVTSPAKVPELKLEASPTFEEEISAGVPRKESRFCLEDAPPTDQLETLASVAQSALRLEHLAPPDAAERERSRGLVGQENAVLSIISTVLEEDIGMDTNIWEHGCDSISAIEISSSLEQHLGFSVEPHLLFAYQTPRALLEKLKRTLLHLCSPVGAEPDGLDAPPLPLGSRRSLMSSQEDEVAIVGMACQFPGCSSPEELWELLTEKKVTVSHFQDPTTGTWIHGGFTDRMAVFDYKWFNTSEREAATLDPQQSLLLHTASECLRRSGYTSLDEVRGSRIGVFIGFWGSDTRALSLSSEKKPPYTSYIGTMTANRISYAFDLKGPSMAVDTACAASLTALEVAIAFLHLGKCSEALVGGVNALLDPRVFEVSSEMGVTSPKGESLVFDVEARGYVRGEGCGMVLVKRVRDALRHRNRILAVVRSVESLHNGISATPTAPNIQSQSQLLRTSLGSATLGPSDLSYFEAHGTGTPLGDPMEMTAIQEVFATQSEVNREPRVGPLIVGSIKANIGHLEAAAGIAGIIKTVLVLEHAKAPGNPGLKTLNPAMKIESEKILHPTEMVALDSHYMYRPQSYNLLSAAVSSFGIGGSIANAVLQQFSQLPHLGQTECSLILEGEIGDTTRDQVMTAIQLLRARLRPFNSAYRYCVEGFQRAMKPVKVPACEMYYHHPAFLTFCLLYSIARTLQAHGTDLSFMMGTTLCAEMVVLAVSDVLLLSDAMRVLLAGMAPHVFNIKFIIEEEMEPMMSFLSPTLNQLCLPGRFPPASLNQLIYEVQRKNPMQSTCSNPSLAANLVSIAKSGYGPLLTVTLHPESTIVKATKKISKSASVLNINSPGLIDHFRETCLQLRANSDKIISKTDGPSADVEMPRFYERFPMRAVQRGLPVQKVKGEGRVRTPGKPRTKSDDVVKPKHRLSCADESGYLTQTTSAESLKNSTPVTSPTKPHPKPHPPVTLPTDPTMSSTEKAILSGTMDFIRGDLLSDLALTDEEAGERELPSLGLDSVALIELQDHLLQSWKVDLPLLRMMSDLNTIRAIAREVAELSEENRKQEAKKGAYYTIPPTEELGLYSREKLSGVQNFTVGRWGYGKVEFFGTADISELDLHSQLVESERGSIRLGETSKLRLNQPALLFFKSASSSSSSSQGVGERGGTARELLKSLGDSASLVNSDWATGEVVIKIDRFPS